MISAAESTEIKQAIEPTTPDWLDGDALDLWRELTPQLTEAGIIGSIDRNCLARYCRLWQRWRQSENHIDDHGAVVKAPSGYPVLNPHVSIASRIASELGRLERQLGLTPAARSTKATTTLLRG